MKGLIISKEMVLSEMILKLKISIQKTGDDPNPLKSCSFLYFFPVFTLFIYFFKRKKILHSFLSFFHYVLTQEYLFGGRRVKNLA